LAEPAFDAAVFHARLATRRLGRALLVRAVAESTNDLAWEALDTGAADGTVVIADEQTRGRGRAGRSWHAVPGKSLVLSLALRLGGGAGPCGTIALAAGLALARGLDRLGVRARLKWPNDLLLGGRKVAGILVEARPAATGGTAAVVGVGINVALEADDFPADLRDLATSLVMEGHRVRREEVAAELLNALEPLWTEHQQGDRAAVLDAWCRRADFWGEPVTLRTPTGPLSGVACSLDEHGALVLRLEGGGETAVLAGDLDLAGPAERSAP
jgi:BirA family biotin operon repressor/biotin-[acetyl-CoA-carboxylase] ligase